MDDYEQGNKYEAGKRNVEISIYQVSPKLCALSIFLLFILKQVTNVTNPLEIALLGIIITHFIDEKNYFSEKLSNLPISHASQWPAYLSKFIVRFYQTTCTHKSMSRQGKAPPLSLRALVVITLLGCYHLRKDNIQN